MPIPVVITAYADRSFTLHHQDAAEHVLPEEGGEDRQGQPDRRQGRSRWAASPCAQLREIAEIRR